MLSENKLLTARAEDLFRLCDKYSQPQFSHFLNENEQAVLQREIGDRYGYNVMYYGGYSEAQRKLFGVFPEWEEPSGKAFPIKTVKITKTYKKELSHRDYLGSVMSHGITREQIGDIVIDENTAYILAMEDIADYIALNITKIGNVGVKAEGVETDEVITPEIKFKTINTVAASLRLDAVVAAMLNVSRKESASMILSGNVSVNHIPSQDTARQLKTDNVISVRGFGRYIFEGVHGTTGSGRIHIIIKKYI